MAIERVQIGPVMEGIRNQLKSLESKIGDNVSKVNEDELTHLITKLSHDVNQMTTVVKQHRIIGPIEEDLSDSLIKLIHVLQHTPAYSQVLGTLQTQLNLIFKRIENIIPEATNEVKRVENDRLDAR
jgi:hypothetical protein